MLRRLLLACLLFTTVAHADKHFLTLSDIHYGHDNKMGYGHDTNDDVFWVMLNQYWRLLPKSEFVLLLGDLPTHLGMESSERAKDEYVVFQYLYHPDSHHTVTQPVFYVPGNNDPLTGDYQRFEKHGQSPLTVAASAGWTGPCINCEGQIIDDSGLAHGGYYSAYPMKDDPNTVLIALNTTMFMKKQHYPEYEHQSSAAKAQLDWLEGQLQQINTKHLLIAMHEPPGKSSSGKSFWKSEYKDRFIDLLTKYQPKGQRVSLFTSHTHFDEIRKIELSTGNTIYGYSTPSISMAHDNNPGMKLYSFDDGYGLSNFTTYYTTPDDIKNKSWGHKRYSAMNDDDSIFPGCHDLRVGECISRKSVNICKAFDAGNYHGVKSPEMGSFDCDEVLHVN